MVLNRLGNVVRMASAAETVEGPDGRLRAAEYEVLISSQATRFQGGGRAGPHRGSPTRRETKATSARSTTRATSGGRWGGQRLCQEMLATGAESLTYQTFRPELSGRDRGDAHAAGALRGGSRRRDDRRLAGRGVALRVAAALDRLDDRRLRPAAIRDGEPLRPDGGGARRRTLRRARDLRGRAARRELLGDAGSHPGASRRAAPGFASRARAAASQPGARLARSRVARSAGPRALERPAGARGPAPAAGDDGGSSRWRRPPRPRPT